VDHIAEVVVRLSPRKAERPRESPNASVPVSRGTSSAGRDLHPRRGASAESTGPPDKQAERRRLRRGRERAGDAGGQPAHHASSRQASLRLHRIAPAPYHIVRVNAAALAAGRPGEAIAHRLDGDRPPIERRHAERGSVKRQAVRERVADMRASEIGVAPPPGLLDLLPVAQHCGAQAES
jgi:hypothetical protein